MYKGGFRAEPRGKWDHLKAYKIEKKTNIWEKNQELKAIQLENEAGCLRPSIKDRKKLEITSLARIYAKVFGNYVEAFESDIIKVILLCRSI